MVSVEEKGERVGERGNGHRWDKDEFLDGRDYAGAQLRALAGNGSQQGEYFVVVVKI